MALERAVRTFTVLASDVNGTTGTVNLPAGFDLKLVLFVAVGRSGTGMNAPLRLSQGAASAATARFACGSDSPDAIASGDAYSIVRNDAVIAWPETGTTLLGGRIDLSAFGATSFTWIVDAQLPVDVEVQCLCLGGSDITNVAVGTTQSPASAIAWNGPDLGFDPTPQAAGRTALILMGAAFLDTVINQNEGAGGLSLGFATSSSEQGVVAAVRRNSPTPGSSCIYNSGLVYANNFGGAGGLHTSHTFTEWRGAGAGNTFRLTKGGDGDMTYQGHMGYVVIKGPRFKVHTFALATATGNFSETDPGFATTALLAVSSNRATASQSAFVTDWEMAIGMAADPGTVEQGSVWTLDPDLATTDVQQRLDKTRAFLNYSRTAADTFAIESDGTFVGDEAAGYTLNQNDADATAYLWLALAIGAAPVLTDGPWINAYAINDEPEINGNEPSSGTQYTQAVGGTLSSADVAGALVKQTRRALTGSIAALAGDLAKQTRRALTGAIDNTRLVGDLTKRAQKVLTGSIATITGALSAAKIVLLSLAGAISTIAGTMTKRANKPVGGTLSSADVAGALVKQTRKALTGDVSSVVGTLTKRTTKVLTGAFGSTGTAPNIFAHGFDDNTLGGLVNGESPPNGDNTIVVDATAIGGRSVEQAWTSGTANACTLWADPAVIPTAQTNLYARWRFKMGTGFVISGTIFKFLRYRVGSYGTIVCSLLIHSGRFVMAWDDYDNAEMFQNQGTEILPADLVGTGWHWFESQIDLTTTNALRWRFWIDGVLKADATLVQPNRGYTMQTLEITGTYNSPAATATTWFDELGISTAQMGVPGPGLAGALTAAKVALRALTATIAANQLVGEIRKRTSRALDGAISTLAGGLLASKVALLSLTGAIANTALTATVSGVKVAVQALSGSISSLTGALVRRTQRSLDGAVTSAGMLARSTRRALTATIAAAQLAGAVAGQKVALLTLVGAIAAANLVGTLTRQAQKTLSGASTPTGTITKQTRRQLLATAAGSGALGTIRITGQVLAGALAPAGALVIQFAAQAVVHISMALKPVVRIAARLTAAVKVLVRLNDS